MLTEELSVFVSDFGLPAISGSNSGLVIFDTPDMAVFGDAVQTSEIRITFLSSEFPTMTHNDAITIDGTSYTVREVMRLDDGKFKQATLKS